MKCQKTTKTPFLPKEHKLSAIIYHGELLLKFIAEFSLLDHVGICYEISAAGVKNTGRVDRRGGVHVIVQVISGRVRAPGHVYGTSTTTGGTSLKTFIHLYWSTRSTHTLPVVITIFTHVRLSVHTFQNRAKDAKSSLPVVCGLA